MNMRTLTIASILGIGCAIAAAQVISTRLEARLAGAGKGKAKWQLVQKGREIQSEFEVEGERLPSNTSYDVYVGDQFIGTVTTNGFGAFSAEKRYLGANHPNVAAGMTVTVANTGGVVLSGVFAAR